MRIRPVGTTALLIEVNDVAAWTVALTRRRHAGDFAADEIVPGRAETAQHRLGNPPPTPATSRKSRSPDPANPATSRKSRSPDPANPATSRKSRGSDAANPTTSDDGTLVDTPVSSICVHGDTAGAMASARAIRAALTAAGIETAPFTDPPRAGRSGLER